MDPFLSKYKAFVAGFWKSICEKLNKVPVEDLSSFKESVEKNLQLMKREGVDLSILEQRVAELFKKAQDYDQTRSQISGRMTLETQMHMLLSTQAILDKAQKEHSKSAELLLSNQKTLDQSNERETELEKAIEEAEKVIRESKEKLKDIHTQKPSLQTLVTEAKKRFDVTQSALTTAKTEFERIQESEIVQDEDEDKLTAAKKELEAYKDDLINFQPF